MFWTITGTAKRDGETHDSLATTKGLRRDFSNRERRKGPSRTGEAKDGGKTGAVHSKNLRTLGQ